MGMNVFTFCRSCLKMAPMLAEGEGGFTGRPSADRSATRFEGGLQNFGYVYSAFEAIGLVTHDLFRFNEFLVSHAGHSIETLSDGGPAEADPDLARVEGDEEEEWADELPEGWQFAHFEVRCRTCKKRHRTDDPAVLRSSAERVLAPEQIELFADAVLPLLEDNMYRCEPLGDRELARVAGFLKRHDGHQLAARLVAEEG
jgi:hypothetical protein